jgi:UPF0716 protein FxsA
VLPLVELYVIVQAGQSIGVLPTLGLLLLASFLGAWLVKREGRKTWLAFRKAIEEGRVPAKETADGALAILGGALLLTPGFVTDVFGLAFVAPPTRAVVRRFFLTVAATRMPSLRWFAMGRTGATAARKVRSQRAASSPAADRRPANVPPPSLPPE